jgi:hypothetical protein
MLDKAIEDLDKKQDVQQREALGKFSSSSNRHK